MDIALEIGIVLQSVLADLDAACRAFGTGVHDRRQEVEIVGGVGETYVEGGLLAGATVASAEASCGGGGGDGAVGGNDGRGGV
jgi:hypothetical protein